MSALWKAFIVICLVISILSFVSAVSANLKAKMLEVEVQVLTEKHGEHITELTDGMEKIMSEVNETTRIIADEIKELKKRK